MSHFSNPEGRRFAPGRGSAFTVNLPQGGG